MTRRRPLTFRSLVLRAVDAYARAAHFLLDPAPRPIPPEQIAGLTDVLVLGHPVNLAVLNLGDARQALAAVSAQLQAREVPHRRVWLGLLCANGARMRVRPASPGLVGRGRLFDPAADYMGPGPRRNGTRPPADTVLPWRSGVGVRVVSVQPGGIAHHYHPGTVSPDPDASRQALLGKQGVIDTGGPAAPDGTPCWWVRSAFHPRYLYRQTELELLRARA